VFGGTPNTTRETRVIPRILGFISSLPILHP
jgi:hypothetical protein